MQSNSLKLVALLALFSVPLVASADRIWSTGFEQNSATAGIECNSISGSPITTTTVSNVRSGTYALSINGLTSGTRKTCDQQFLTAASSGPFYARSYFKFTTFPTVTNSIISWSSATATLLWVNVDSSGNLTLNDGTGQIGSAFTISTGNWYNIETLYSRNTSASNDTAEMRVNLSSKASSTARSLGGTILSYNEGGNLRAETATNGNWVIDDTAINSTGSVQNNFPGEGHIAHLRPAAAGDNTNGSSTGAANAFTAMSEITPDTTTYQSVSSTGAALVDVKLDNIASTTVSDWDKINLVQVGAYWACAAAAGCNTTLRLKSQSGGTVQFGATTTVAINTFSEHDDSQPKVYKLTSYTEPQNGGAWTPQLLQTAQIGFGSDDVTPNPKVSTMWLLFDYTTSTSLVAHRWVGHGISRNTR